LNSVPTSEETNHCPPSPRHGATGTSSTWPPEFRLQGHRRTYGVGQYHRRRPDPSTRTRQVGLGEGVVETAVAPTAGTPASSSTAATATKTRRRAPRAIPATAIRLGHAVTAITVTLMNVDCQHNDAIAGIAKYATRQPRCRSGSYGHGRQPQQQMPNIMWLPVALPKLEAYRQHTADRAMDTL
jgi:hypothetical protein